MKKEEDVKDQLVEKWVASVCTGVMAKKGSYLLAVRKRTDGRMFAVVKSDSVGSVIEVIEEVNSSRIEPAVAQLEKEAERLGFKMLEECSYCPFS